MKINPRNNKKSISLLIIGLIIFLGLLALLIVALNKQSTPLSSAPYNEPTNQQMSDRAALQNESDVQEIKRPSIDDAVNPYPKNTGAWWVFKRKIEVGVPLPSSIGNECNFTEGARTAKIATNAIVRKWSIANFASSSSLDAPRCNLGFVESVNNDGSFSLTGYNLFGIDGLTKITYKSEDVDNYNFLFID